jgi:chemotaxis protein MotA
MKNIIGLFICTSIFVVGFAIHGNVPLYFNLSGFMIVVGGTFAASLISFKVDQLRNVARVLVAAYRRPVTRETDIINLLIDLSIRSRMSGILTLQNMENETTVLFLRRALACLVDGYKIEQMRDILNTEMYFFRMRRDDSERVIRAIADYFPAFGLIGSIVGLIAMLGGVGDTSVILRCVPIALTSTLYGLTFANFFCLPFAATVRERTNQELLLQKIIMEGVIAINSEINPIILKTKLESFLTPSERETKLLSYAKLRERFKIELEQQQAEVAAERESLSEQFGQAPQPRAPHSIPIDKP